MSKTDVYFIRRGSDEDDVPRSIMAVKGLDQFEVVRMVAVGDMYRAGLEKDYKKLVNMGDIATSLMDLLNAYHNLGKLDLLVWDRIITLYQPFIAKSKEYRAVMEFMEGEVW